MRRCAPTYRASCPTPGRRDGRSARACGRTARVFVGRAAWAVALAAAVALAGCAAARPTPPGAAEPAVDDAPAQRSAAGTAEIEHTAARSAHTGGSAAASPRFAFATRWRDGAPPPRGAPALWTIAVVLEAAVDPLTIAAGDFAITTGDGRRLLPARARVSAAPWPLAPWLVLLEGVTLGDAPVGPTTSEPDGAGAAVQVTLVGTLSAADGRTFARDPMDVAPGGAAPRLALVATIDPTPTCPHPLWLLASEPSGWGPPADADAAAAMPSPAAAAAAPAGEHPLVLAPLEPAVASASGDALVVRACAAASVVAGERAEVVAPGLATADGRAFTRQSVLVLDGRTGARP